MKVHRKLSLFLVSMLIISFSLLGFKDKSKAVAVDYVDYFVTVDEHENPLPKEEWYYNYTGGDRGVLNAGDISYSWNGDSVYTATVVSNPGLWTWGGMWHSLIRVNKDNIPLDFKAIFGPYVKSEFQGEINEIEIVISNVSSPSNNSNLQFKIELKDVDDNTICYEIWSDLISGPYPKTYTWSIPESCKQKVKLVLWVIDRAQVGDAVSIDGVRLKARVPDLATIPTEEQAFLWTYSWLMTNYDPNTGMIQDRSNFKSGDFENVTATAKAAKIAYYAYKKGYTTYEDAQAIITKIADTFINVIPRGPPGINTLWPHFTKNGGAEAIPPHNGYSGTEWASGDTAYAALDIITALQMLGNQQVRISALENFLKDIDWAALLQNNGSISHGYDYDGNPLSSSWKGFGMETLGVNWAYASATGNIAVMEPPPSDNGSGFIDNVQYPIVFSGTDYWGNDWDVYRNNMADTQTSWYCSLKHYNAYLCNAGLFGLSAGENPEGNPNVNSYEAYGTGGKYTCPEEGDGKAVVLHYSGMIADIRPTEAKQMWEVLRDGNKGFLQDRVVVSPLNNMESMDVDKNTGKLTINHLKGSWNLVLQAEGWAQTDPDIRNDLLSAIQNNTFLNNGYNLLKCNNGNPSEEFCDGVDNDCDGEIDEGIPNRNGIIVPAYCYPTWWDPQANCWDDLIEAAQKVQIIAIMNPASGPGECQNPPDDCPDTNYERAVNDLGDFGGKVIGYVSTNYGDKDKDGDVDSEDINACKGEVDKYYTWYNNIDGIFFDEMSTDPNKIPFYKELYDYVVNKGGIVVGNPGTKTDEGYLNCADILNIFENHCSEYSKWTPDDWIKKYDSSYFSNMIYDVPHQSTMEYYLGQTVSKNIGWVYITDDTLTNPWDTLPCYWGSEVEWNIGLCDGSTGEGCCYKPDNDGIKFCKDNCPNDANPDQTNSDADKLGDVCDICPNDAGNDVDGDGFCAGTGENSDCDDGDFLIYPGAPELCDGKDNDCDVDTYEKCGTTINLNSGWNLISLCVEPMDKAIGTVLAPISGKYISVWAYINGGWKVYDPQNPGFSDLTTMEAGWGYWINMSEAATLTVSGSNQCKSIPLVDGWNLIPCGCINPVPIIPYASALCDGKYVSIWAFIGGSWKVYDPNNPSFSDLTTLECGYGCWVNTTEVCTWTMP